jgi:hypothetical protein
VFSSQSGSLSISQIAEKYRKAVVLVEAFKGDVNSALGSGLIVNSSGIIITNFHVIEGAYPVKVKLSCGDIYDDIGVIDIDERKDIAIIKIKGWNLPEVKLGNSDVVKVGDQIVVIGNPKGLENSVTDGLISGIRDTGKGYKMNQISAPISLGSSGSPVFNMRGEVVGIATSSQVEGQNLNFSIPINYARGMINDEVKMTLEEFSKQFQRDPLSATKPEALSASKEIRERIIAQHNNGNLGIREFTVCSKIFGFASYVPRPNSVFNKKGTLLVYYEPANVYTELRNGQYEIWYTQDMILMKENGWILKEWKDIQNFRYTANKPVLDLYAQNSLPFEGQLSAGIYRFKVVLKDRLSGKTASKTIYFEIR